MGKGRREQIHVLLTDRKVEVSLHDGVTRHGKDPLGLTATSEELTTVTGPVVVESANPQLALAVTH